MSKNCPYIFCKFGISGTAIATPTCKRGHIEQQHLIRTIFICWGDLRCWSWFVPMSRYRAQFNSMSLGIVGICCFSWKTCFRNCFKRYGGTWMPWVRADVWRMRMNTYGCVQMHKDSYSKGFNVCPPPSPAPSIIATAVANTQHQRYSVYIYIHTHIYTYIYCI